MSKVVHEVYLRAFLDGVAVQRKNKFDTCEVWEDFDLGCMTLNGFTADGYVFRYKPKIIEVNLNDFYAEYDSCNSTNHKAIFLEELIEKYLPRDGGK